MMHARSIGPEMIEYLERSGVERLLDLVGAEPQSHILQIEVETGVRLNQMGLVALKKLGRIGKRYRQKMRSHLIFLDKSSMTMFELFT